jgi:C4-dicarboxylate transporter, DctM subunit
MSALVLSRARLPLLALTALAAGVWLTMAALSQPEGPGMLGVAVIGMALVGLAALGAPLFVILGVVGALCFLLFGEGYDTFDSFQVFIVKIANLSTKNVLLAIPFFVASGAIMSAGTIASRLINLARALTCWLPGGLAVATVFACVFFSAISGSSPVTVIAIGSLMLPAMLKERYREGFSLGLLSAAGSLGIVIPPSIPMLVYALVASNTAPVDVGEMFLAGVVPGAVLALMLCAYAVVQGVRTRTPVKPLVFSEVAQAFSEGAWALGLPVVILGGIYSGLFTPTEAAAVSVAYALVVELFIHRQLSFAVLSRTLLESGVTLGALLMIMALTFGLNDFLVEQRIPEQAASWIAAKQLSPLEFLLAMNVLLILVGCLMDSLSALMILAPLLVPIGYALGIDLVHLGMIFIINLEIGYLTPPVGMNLFVASSVFKRPLGVVIKGSLPFVALLAVGLVMMTWVPTFSLGLVNVAMRDAPFYAPFPDGPRPAIAHGLQGEGTDPSAPADEAPAVEGVRTLQQMMDEARRRREAEAEVEGETSRRAQDSPGP